MASSAVDIERDPDWQNYRDVLAAEEGPAAQPRLLPRRRRGRERPRRTRADAPPGPRRILLSVHVDVPEGGTPIDTGALRGTIDPDGNRIRGRLWLDSEQGERVVDLRREP